MIRNFSRSLLVVVLALSVAASIGRAQSCTPSWSTDFGYPGAQSVYCSTVFDDGSGPALYIGGGFPSIGGIRAAGVAKWDGSHWSQVGSGLYALTGGYSAGRIYSLAVYNGRLYACGNFRRIGSSTTDLNKRVAFLAAFNGVDWEQVGGGIPDSTNTFPNQLDGGDFSWAQANSLGVVDTGSGPKLYVTGNFLYIRGNSGNLMYAGGIASWDGTTLAPLGASPGFVGSAVIGHDEDGPGGNPPRLFLATTDNVYRFDGISWSPLVGGIPINGYMTSLASYNGYLYTNPWGGSTYPPADSGLVRWDGTGWSQVTGGGIDPGILINSLLTADIGNGPQLFVSANSPSASLGYVFSFDGTTAHSFGPHDIGGSLEQLSADGSKIGQHLCNLSPAVGGKHGLLAVAQALRSADNTFTPGFAVWDGTQYSNLFGKNGTQFVSDTNLTYGAAVYDDPSTPGHRPAIYIAPGGGIGSVPSAWVAKYDGQNWSQVGAHWPNPPTDSILFPLSVQVFDTATGPKLYTSSEVRDDSTAHGPYYTRLDGDTWVNVPAPEGIPRNSKAGPFWVTVDEAGDGVAPPTVYHNQLDSGDNHLVRLVAGSFTPVPGAPPAIRAMAAFDEDGAGPGHEKLFVGGNNSVANTPFPGGVQRFDGVNWSQVGDGLNGPVYGLYASSAPGAPGLIAAGNFTASGGGTPLNHVARWDGAAWQPLGAGVNGVALGFNATLSMTTWDDGTGPKLVLGAIADTSVRPNPYVAEFDGSNWIPLNAPNGGFFSANPNLAPFVNINAFVSVPILLPFDDGATRPSLYAFGTFMAVDGNPSSAVARLGCPIPVAGSGVCCRGSTCNSSIAQASCVGSGNAGAVFASAASACNASGNGASPCCYADYNKQGGVSVADIFDFLNDWFAGNPMAAVGGDGTTGTLSVQHIFDFLNFWFSGC
jgi:hypothetical protein